MCQENSCSSRTKRRSQSERRHCGIGKSVNSSEKVTKAYVSTRAHHLNSQLTTSELSFLGWLGSRIRIYTESARRAGGAGDVRLHGRRDTPTLKGLTSIFVYARRVNRTWLILSRKICPRAGCTSTVPPLLTLGLFCPKRLLRPRPPYTFFVD